MLGAKIKDFNEVNGRHRLQRFLAVVVTLSIVVPAVISGGLLIFGNYQRTLNQESLAIAESYADLLGAGMSIPLWNVSPNLGQPLLESVFVDSLIQGVTVYNEDGDKFLEYSQGEMTGDGQLRKLVRPVLYFGDELGSVELWYSLARAKDTAAKGLQQLIIILVVQLVFSLATISFVLHRRVLSPLSKLGIAAKGIAQGDLKTAMPTVVDDEFGDLSRQLETMRGSLEANFTQMGVRVSERTQELQSVNHAMSGALDQLRQAQDSLIQSEKLAALGSLVAGVAHELNTPIGNGLTVTTTLCESCVEMTAAMKDGLTKTALDKFVDDMVEGTELVNRNLERASELVSSFKQVAVDRTSANRREFSLLAIISETCLTVSPAYKRTPYIVNIDIDTSDDVTLDSYPGPLGQVITNLLNNAMIHAFDGRDQGEVLLTSRVVENGVELYVKDNGVGIPAGNLAKIFDPFFTTKLGAGGNGLGMHIVHNIVTGVLGGDITLVSKEGEGTVFTIFLPLKAPLGQTLDHENE